jgi:adenosylhomocysteine nucleosidase
MRFLVLFAALLSPLFATERILILGAVPQEIVPIDEALANRADILVDGIPCETGEIGGHAVVVALTGVGKTNSAMVTTAMILHWRPAAALMTGTAARIRRTVRTGDIIIATDTIFHDAGSLTAHGMVQGKLDSDGHLVTTTWFSPTREKTDPFHFADTPAWVRYATQVAATYVPPAVTVDGTTYQPVVRAGRVATGDFSGVTEAKIADIREKIDPDLMEMESAGFVQVCSFFHIPHLVIRSGSNWAEERNNDDYLRLSPIAARQAALFTVFLVKNLPALATNPAP